MSARIPLFQIAIGLTSFALAVSGCNTSKARGGKGALTFSYATTHDARTFNKPIAVGARLHVYVHGNSVGRPAARIESVKSSDPSILRARKLGENVIEVEGVGEGDARISVYTLVEGQVERDFVWMSAREATGMQLRHACEHPDATSGIYLTNTRARIPYTLTVSDGRQAIGWGYYPVTFTPADAATLAPRASDQGALAVAMGATPGRVRIESPLSQVTWSMVLVEPGEIDGAALELGATSLEVGSETTYRIYPTSRGARICHAGFGMVPTVLNRRVCRVVDLDGEQGTLTLEGVNPGLCRVAVTLPMGNGGAGASSVVELPVSE